MSNKNIEVIRFEHLTKKFKSWESPPDRQLKSLLISMLKFKFSTGCHRQQTVINDVNLSIYKAEFIGIMGRNGIGKSTILKLISGIYKPTIGSVVSNYKVIPLLELGAGFDPELTGYENIFLNAAMLGFSKADVVKEIENIIAFSELKNKVNSLVRNYSSGMTVRLGFSIAIHMNFDVLLLDEVLGVGDAGFVKKSIDKIIELNQTQQKTIILVTHDPEQVLKYCSRCIVLGQDGVEFDGSVKDGTNAYNGMFNVRN